MILTTTITLTMIVVLVQNLFWPMLRCTEGKMSPEQFPDQQFLKQPVAVADGIQFACVYTVCTKPV